MMQFFQTGPLWRRALLSSLATVGASTSFILVVLVLVGTVIDLAVASTTDAPAELDPSGSTVSAVSKTRDHPPGAEASTANPEDPT